MKVKKNCLTCNKKFVTEQKEVNRGNGKFCSRSCSSKSSRKKTMKVKVVVCSYCKIDFEKPISKLGNSKSGLFFCCRKHKDLGQRFENGLTEIHPPHYKGIGNYREIAFKAYGKLCSVCGYNKISNVLEVHHIDRNRSNNSVDNLSVLCPNCHQENHFLNEDGRFTKSYSC